MGQAGASFAAALNLRVPDPSRFFEGSEGLAFVVVFATQ